MATRAGGRLSTRFAVFFALGALLPMLIVGWSALYVSGDLLYQMAWRTASDQLFAVSTAVETWHRQLVSLSVAIASEKSVQAYLSADYRQEGVVRRFDTEWNLGRDYLTYAVGGMREQIDVILLSSNGHALPMVRDAARYPTWEQSLRQVEAADPPDAYRLSLIDPSAVESLGDNLLFARSVQDEEGRRIGMIVFGIPRAWLYSATAAIDRSLIGVVDIGWGGQTLVSISNDEALKEAGGQLVQINRDIGETDLKATAAVPLSLLRSPVRAIRRSIFLSAGAVLALTLLVGLFMVRRISRPLTLLRAHALRLGAGDLQSRYDAPGSGEVADLARCMNELAGRIGQLMENAVRAREQSLMLEMQVRQAQLSPHFMHNALGTIKYMALLEQVPAVAELCTALGDILESAMREPGKLVPLKEELRLLRSYVFIQKQRYPNKFDVLYDVAEDTLGQMIPVLLLQPLVENATFHAMGRKPFFTIRISARFEDDALSLRVWDDGAGMSEEKLRALSEPSDVGDARHIGLANVRSRVRLLYGEPWGLTVESRLDEGTCAQIRLPRKGGPS